MREPHRLLSVGEILPLCSLTIKYQHYRYVPASSSVTKQAPGQTETVLIPEYQIKEFFQECLIGWYKGWFRFERFPVFEIKPRLAFRHDHKRGIMIHISCQRAEDGLRVVISKTLRTFVSGIHYGA